MTRAVYIRAGLRSGLSIKETLLLPVGIVMDLSELYMREKGLKPEKDNFGDDEEGDE
jgi:hypothetical protein